MGGGGGPSPGGRPGVNSAQQEQLRQKLRQLDPAQVKKMPLPTCAHAKISSATHATSCASESGSLARSNSSMECHQG